MAKDKENTPDPTVENPEVQEFLTDPRHAKQRDFMTALIRKVHADDVAAARTKTQDVGGTFLDNLIDGMTGGLFGDKK